jgi:uncharacterized protein (DUF983 family)
LNAALLGLCPRCGRGRLFDGYLHLAPKCASCGLDFGHLDAGDGPAVFVILIVGGIVAAGALFVEFTFHPPYWVHVVLWLPLVLVLSLSLLRVLKSLLLILQFRHQAHGGRLE